jgi:hypothetical protein
MSSRSLLAARARRSGENPPPVSGNRPGTSIGSHAAFAPQPPGYQTNMPPPPPNVRVQRGQQPSQQMQQQRMPAQQQAPSNNMPFSKLSVSDAIGLITLRLGRVEQWIIETDHENEVNQNNGSNNANAGLPENSRIIDNSVLSSIINRLEAVEKTPVSTGGASTEQMTELSASVNKLTEQFTKMGDDVVKHTMEISKHNEQMFRYNRELTETKDILKTFMIRYDGFVKESNDKFSDYEFALSELEKNVNVQPQTELVADVSSEEAGTDIIDGSIIENSSTIENVSTNDNIIMSMDLKNIIKQELASSTA